MMPKYLVELESQGRIHVEVEANDPQEAKDIAEQMEADGELLDNEFDTFYRAVDAELVE